VPGAAGLLAGSAAVTWPDLLGAAHTRPLAHRSGILVLVTLYGGNDGINTVVPYADSAYRSARPELAYDADEVLHLDDQLGLNPGLGECTSCGRRRYWPLSGTLATQSPTEATSRLWISGRPPP
jgi:uncharacterized protein (DUF1501 family)